MSSSICTLFEGDYHYGLGALANSLYVNGFRGTIFAGHRGPLPPWVIGPKEFDGFTEFQPAQGLTLRFIPLTTRVHLTNYKPDFMLRVWKMHAADSDSMFYFDPDITIKCRWGFFQEWVQGGVALCEDVNSPMPSSHPIRNAWRSYYAELGRLLKNCLDTYVNGGFVGVSLKHRAFLEEWCQIQQEMAPAAQNMMGWGLQDRTFKFCFTDQDALNITLMNTAMPISLSGKDGMDIERMGYIMSHALGGRKPWRRNYIWERLSLGFSPGAADKRFWANSSQPIGVTGTLYKLLKMADLKAAAAFGRMF